MNQKRRERLEAENAELRALLKEIQWKGWDYWGHEDECPVCEFSESGGHADDCRLAAAIKEKTI